MLKNYIKIAWRNLFKNRTFSIINIAGLSFSVAFCLLVFFYIRNEQSYDLFHTKKDRLFRMEMANSKPTDEAPEKSMFSFLTRDDGIANRVSFPLVVGPDMQKTFPDIKSIIRFQTNKDKLVKIGDRIFKEPDVLYADYTFFSSFSFPLVNGNPVTAFANPYSVILTETAAKKYFGNENPVGKTISFIGDSAKLFTVTGIAADAPVNSSIQFGIVVPLLAHPDYEENMQTGLNHSSEKLIVELNKNVSATQFQSKINKWIKQRYVEREPAADGKYYAKEYFKDYSWYLRPFADCHYNISYWGHYTNTKNIYQLACLVIIILLIASLNYVLIVISNAAARSQEVGIRKVMGANRRSVILQFWVETQIIVAIAVLTALVLARIFLPLFNNITGAELNFQTIRWTAILPVLLALSFLLGIIAGYYPALIISKMKPASIIKNFSTFKINPLLSKVLIVFQYTSCVVLMISAFVISRQMHFISNKSLGFDKEQVLIVNNPGWGDASLAKRANDRLPEFARTLPAVIQYGRIYGSLTSIYNHNGFMLNGQQQWMSQVAVDYNYFDMLGIKFVQGRPFSRAILSDTSSTIRPAVVNETLFNLLGKDAKLDVYNETIRATIIGVVKDYHFESLSKKIEPEKHVLIKDYASAFMFKIRPGEVKATIAKIEKEWKSLTGNYPFDYTFLDQTIAQLYEPEMRWQNTIEAASFFAIFIACMGLFGLSAINAVNRTKEIGIRKILGASLKDIVRTLSADFVVMILISILIATPAAWWIMNRWLEDFAYRIDISWWMFAIVGCIALAIALLTTSIQAVKAALANPVDSLRNE